MKIYLLRMVVVVLCWVCAPSLSYAGSAAPKTVEKTAPVVKTKKELRKQKRAERLSKFIQKRMDKRIQKKNKKYGKDGFSDLDRNLQLAILFGAAAVAFSILGSIIGPIGTFGLFWTLASIAWVVGVVFLVLWLIENV